MKKSLMLLAVLALCRPGFAQDQQPVPEPDPDSPQQFPLPVPQQFEQNGETNGITQEAVGELLQELARMKAEEAARQGESLPKAGESLSNRRIRGEGTRGTMGSGTNAIPLSILLKSGTTGGTNGLGLRLNFRNASLSLVLDYLSEAAGFIVSANSKVDLQGRVTVWSNQPVERMEAIRLLNTALTQSGYAATIEGNLLNIYVVDPTNTEIVEGIPGNSYTNIPATKDLVTQIVYVHNVEANQLISTLQPLMPAGTSMSANQGANAILVTDTKANIRRMAQLVKALDTSSVSASKLEVIPLSYADATALAQVFSQVFQTDSSSSRSRGGFGGGGFPGFGEMFGGRGGDRSRDSGGSQSGRMTTAKITAVADERSNSLVVSAPEDQMPGIIALVNKMDVNVDDIAELKVFKLRHADPQETADQLATLFPDPTQQNNNRSSSRGGFGFFGGFGDRDRGSRSSNGGSDSRKVQQAKVSAVPDPRTGSVIVSASRDVMPDIAGIIEELDKDPAKKKKVYVIKVENRDPAELVEDLQSIISSDTSGNFNQNRSTRQTGSQLSTRQQNNLQNQGNNNSGGVMGNNQGGSGNRTSR